MTRRVAVRFFSLFYVLIEDGFGRTLLEFYVPDVASKLWFWYQETACGWVKLAVRALGTVSGLVFRGAIARPILASRRAAVKGGMNGCSDSSDGTAGTDENASGRIGDP